LRLLALSLAEVAFSTCAGGVLRILVRLEAGRGTEGEVLGCGTLVVVRVPFEGSGKDVEGG
jgi:hypothetical protein